MALALAACATATPTPEPLPVETLRPVPHGRLLYFPPSGTPTARQKELAARTPLPGAFRGRFLRGEGKT